MHVFSTFPHTQIICAYRYYRCSNLLNAPLHILSDLLYSSDAKDFSEIFFGIVKFDGNSMLTPNAHSSLDIGALSRSISRYAILTWFMKSLRYSISRLLRLCVAPSASPVASYVINEPKRRRMQSLVSYMLCIHTMLFHLWHFSGMYAIFVCIPE